MDLEKPFTDPAAVAGYPQSTPQRVPGFADLQRMAMLLLAQRAPAEADILVLGAGGGLELKAFAQARPEWRFVGVDPSAAMLDLAAEVLGPLGRRVELKQGYIDDAPVGPFDGSVCLLTLHFLELEERLRTLKELHRRTKPGAPLVVAHHSATSREDIEYWLTLAAAFADHSAPDFSRASESARVMAEHLPILTTAEDEALLQEAGFGEVRLFYAGLSLRGWVATA
jgi:tRNA (cmo5U34)-methyltransferase